MINGINEEGLDKLIIDIYNYAESVHKVFNNIENIIDDTNNFYQDETYLNVKNKFNDFKKNLDIAYNKLIKSATYLSNIKMYYQDLNIDIGNKLKANESNIIDEIRKD